MGRGLVLGGGGQHVVLRPQKTPEPKAWSQEDPCSGSQLAVLPTSLPPCPAPGTLHLPPWLPPQARPPFWEVRLIRHEGPASSREWPGEQSHSSTGPRLGEVSVNSGNPKTLVELNQAMLFPTSGLIAKSRREGQTPTQSPVNSRGKKESPSQEQVQVLGGVWGGVCNSWLSLFLGGMAPQYPFGRAQLDECSGSTERMGKQKSEVGKVYNTGLRHRNVSRGFGDSRAERWGTRLQQVE